MVCFDISLDDFDCHSRSQLFEKAKMPMCIFSEILLSNWMKFSMLSQSVDLSSSG